MFKAFRNPSALMLYASTVALITSPALAKEPPSLLADTPGVVYEGEVAGLDTWSRAGEDLLWMQTKDGAHIIAGVLFNARGVDMGAAIRGQRGVKIEDILLGRPDDTPLDSAEETTSRIQSDEDGLQTSADANSIMASLSNNSTAAETYLEAQSALTTLSDEARTNALITLVQSIDAAETEEEFRQAILDWRQLVADLVEDETGAIVDFAPAKAEEKTSTEVSGNAVQKLDLTEAKFDNDRLVDRLRTETFWFRVGQSGGPTVYAVIDPTCPFCAKAMQSLKPDVEQGKIDLRIIIAPLVSSNAPDVIAGILASPDPAAAFWQHELDYAVGGSGVDPVEFTELPEDFQFAVRANFDMAVENEVPGVPYFVYENKDGEQSFSGIPQSGHFHDALELPGD